MTAEGPKILTIDIENSPHMGWFWDLWNQNIPLVMVKEFRRMITFSAKWRGDRKVVHWSEFRDGHEQMVVEAHDLLDQADIVVTYNGDKHDLPILHTEFDKYDLGRPSPYHSIDLYKVGKKNKKFASHKLGFITEQLSLGSKLETGGFELWLRALEGDPKAWARMERYNNRDVRVTENLFEFWLPYMDNLPALTLYVDDLSVDQPQCPRCPKGRLEKRGFAYTRLGKFQQYHCLSCGSWPRGRRRVKGVDIA